MTTADLRGRRIVTNMRSGSAVLGPWRICGIPRRAKRGTGKRAAAKRHSLLEQRFANRWRGPAYVEQYRFDPSRRWRLDFAWPDSRVAVETHGGTWANGRHTRGSGFAKDREKMNAAQELGWTVYELTGAMLTDEWLERVRILVEQRKDG